jgi:iron complex transport system substrate-binding protein
VKNEKHLLRKMASAVFALTVCFVEIAVAQAPTTAASSGPIYREVVDEMNRTVRVPQPVRRIVSLAPSVTETIYALGLQDLLVGDTDYCDYPVEAQKKPKVGGTINPSIEHIVALKPDLVLMAKSSNRLETAVALEKLGIASFATDSKNVTDVIASTERISSLLGAPEVVFALAADLEKRLNDLQQRISKSPKRTVLFVVWPEPLISVGKNTFIADALRRAGAVSIIDTEPDWPQVSLEEVVHRQPEFLVFAPAHSEQSNNPAEALAARPGWQDVDAIKNHRIVIVSDAIIRPAPRIVSAIEEMARQIHPEALGDKPNNEKDKLEKTVIPTSNSALLSPIAAARPATWGEVYR